MIKANLDLTLADTGFILGTSTYGTVLSALSYPPCGTA
jgi:hypothetical protein